MPTKQLVIVIAVVALLSAGLGVVITSRMAPKEVKVSIDLGGGKSLDLAQMADRLDSARLQANENAAIETLLAIASAQLQAHASAVIDTDGDTVGEYAYLGEMAGTAPLRAGTDFMVPALLVSSFGVVTPAGIATRSGYHFRVFLPDAAVGGKSPGLPEASGLNPDPDAAEVLWCAFAWPVEAGTTGTRAFFINQDDDLLETPNADHAYNGEDRAPAFDAALSSEYPRDMDSVVPLASLGQSSNDGRPWSSVGY